MTATTITIDNNGQQPSQIWQDKTKETIVETLLVREDKDTKTLARLIKAN